MEIWKDPGGGGISGFKAFQGAKATENYLFLTDRLTLLKVLKNLKKSKIPRV